MDNRLNTPWLALRYGIGLTATLAGIDKFFNLLADWGSYVSPLATQLLPVSTGTFMSIVGVIEFAVGAAILAGWTRLGAYVASGWLLGVAANLICRPNAIRLRCGPPPLRPNMAAYTRLPTFVLLGGYRPS
jgi:hypothetical protein